MKLKDILPEQQLDEISLKQAIAAGLIGTAGMVPSTVDPLSTPTGQQKEIVQMHVDPRIQQMIDIIVNKYNIDPSLAKRVVKLAHKHERRDFPKAEDILAVIGIESSFNPEATSKLRTDPARGLMQVRGKVWGIEPSEHALTHPLYNIEYNIRHGADILSHYYHKLKNKQAALHAYNVGLTAFKRGEKNPNYIRKYHEEIAQYSDI